MLTDVQNAHAGEQNMLLQNVSCGHQQFVNVQAEQVYSLCLG